MNVAPNDRKIVLVVGDKQVFTEFLRSLSCDHFEVCFVEGASDALSLGSLRNLRLVAAPLDMQGAKLADAIKEVSGDTVTTLGIDQGPVEGLEVTPDSFDQVVARTDLNGLAAVARKLLEERRKRPRVMVEFPVRLGPNGTGNVKDISATSLRVLTMMPLEVGEQVVVEIGENVAPFSFEATVGRVMRSVRGQNALVLHIQEDDDPTCQYLEQLVQKVMEVQYYLNGDRPRPGALRGPVSWDLARRVERNLRESQELKAVSAELTTDPPTSQLESRYRLGHHLGSWGVGEVFLASHLLLKRPVTIKVLAQEMREDEGARQRMEREATIPTKVACPGIVDVIDFGEDGHGGLFYTMEALTGETLASLLESDETFSHRDVARLGVHLASALAIAHIRGHGHFDLCPENVFLQKWSGGPAWPLLINVGGAPAEGSLADTHPLGEEFWPPEAPRVNPGPKHDIYGLGSLLEHVLKKMAPGSGEGSKLLREVIWQANTPGQDDRFPDMTVMARALIRCLDDPALPRPKEPARVESPGELKRMFGPAESSARTYSTKMLAETMATFASADPRREGGGDDADKELVKELAIAKAAAAEVEDPQPRKALFPARVPRETIQGTARFVEPEEKKPFPWIIAAAVLAVLVGAAVLWKFSGGPPSDVKPAVGKQTKNKPATGKVPDKAGKVAAKPDGPSLPPLENDEQKSHPVVKANADTDENPTVLTKPSTDPTSKPDARAASAPDMAGSEARRAAIKQARRHLKNKDYDRARLALVGALAIRDSSKLRALLARAFAEDGQPERAVEHMKKAADLEPDVAWFRLKLGRLHLKANDKGEACVAFRRARKIDPTYKPARALVKKHCR